MIPIEYDVVYNIQSVVALLAMILTNAVGDFVSIKITLINTKKLFIYYRKNLGTEKSEESLYKSFRVELLFYLVALRDMAISLIVLLGVLVLTSIYFGVSVGEYKFEFTEDFFFGALNRVDIFIKTAMEPYWFRSNLIDLDNGGWPMLLIYSLTSFLPTFIILTMAILWTIAMPLRIICLSSMNKYKKIFFSELSVLIMCTVFFSISDISIKSIFHIF